MQMKEDIITTGTIKAGSMIYPNGSISNTHVGTSDPITADKLDHQYQPIYQKERGVAPVAERATVHNAYSEGTVIAFAAGVTLATAGTGTFQVDLLKNGVSILAAVIQIDAANVAYVPETAAIATGPYVAGDTFEVEVKNVVAGTGLASGVFARPVFREKAGV
jgi:hypothetical protein